MAKRLRERDIEDLLAALEDGDVSEDGLDDENDDEEEFYNDAREIMEDLLGEDFANDDEASDEPTPEVGQVSEGSDPPLIEDEQDIQFDKRKLIWKIGNLSYDETSIAHEPNPTDENILDLDTPYKCSSHFFTPDFLQKIANETNLYSLCGRIGIWNEKFGYDPVKTVMPVNKFEQIRSLLHFNDNTKHLPKEHPDHDNCTEVQYAYGRSGPYG
ncbi:hypothetical protein ABMA27_003031 [Loxostege sticticalis]|uniref:PiggyBac transposable element-derived protein domain-containing protein n=1 Tax=Loxostege sticticalis TaxID=481309 RepID=A0ABR3HRT3_LOXSC